MKPRKRRRVLPALLGVLVLLLVVAGGGALWVATDGPEELVAREVREVLPPDSRIDRVRIGWQWPPRVELRGVELADGDDERPLARFDRVWLTMRSERLLRGSFAVRDIAVQDGTLNLRRRADGTWNLDSLRGASGELESSGSLSFDDVVVNVQAAGVPQSVKIRIGNLVIADKEPPELLLESAETQGSLRGQASYPAVTQLLRGSRVEAVKVRITNGEGHVAFEGDIAGDFTAIDGRLKVSQPNPAKFAGLFGLKAEGAEPFDLTMRIVHKKGAWRFTEIEAEIAGQPLTGQVVYDSKAEGPAIDAEVEMATLQVPGACGGSEENEDMTGAGGALAWLSGLPLRATIAVDEVRCGRLPLGALEASLTQREEGLGFEVSRFGLAGGTLIATGRWIATEEAEGAIAIDGRMRQLSLAAFKPVLGAEDQQFAGDVNGDFNARFRLARPLASLDGEISALMREGAISKPLVEKLALDLGSITVPDAPSKAEIICAAGTMTFEQGRGTLKSLLIKTPDTLIAAKGTVDLAERRLSLDVQADSESALFFDSSTPIRIEGSFAKPQVSVNKAAAIAGAGVSSLLSVATAPLAGLKAIVTSMGDQDTSDGCGEIVEQAK